MSLTSLPHRAGTPPFTPWPGALCEAEGCQCRPAEHPPSHRDAAKGAEEELGPQNLLPRQQLCPLRAPSRQARPRKKTPQSTICVWRGEWGRPSIRPSFSRRPQGPEGVRAGWTCRAWGQGCWCPELAAASTGTTALGWAEQGSTRGPKHPCVAPRGLVWGLHCSSGLTPRKLRSQLGQGPSPCFSPLPPLKHEASNTGLTLTPTLYAV